MSINPEKLNNESDPLEIKHFSSTLNGGPLHVHLLRLEKSAVIWINSSEISMKNLAVAMPTSITKGSTSVSLFGNQSPATSCNLAQRLSKRTNQQIFVSYNLSDFGANSLNEIEPFLLEILS